jgi:hypothetical protein
MMQSADRPLIGPSTVATLSWLYASATREPSGDCMIFGTCGEFVVTYYKPLSAIDYVDFMRRVKWKFYHSSSKLTKFGTIWISSSCVVANNMRWICVLLFLDGVWLRRVLCFCDLCVYCLVTIPGTSRKYFLLQNIYNGPGVLQLKYEGSSWT